MKKVDYEPERISFTRSVKEEISLIPLNSVLEKKALLSGFIKINSTLSIRNVGWAINIKSENVKTAKLIISLIKELYQVEPRVSISEQRRFKVNNHSKIVHVEISNNVKAILEDLGIYSNEKTFYTTPDFIYSDNDLIRCYLRGCFLANGSVNSPATKNYHFEIALEDYNLANFLIKIIKKFYVEAKSIKRRNQTVVYIKKSDYISDMLRVIGATNSLLYYEDVRIQRDNLNIMNRIENCDISNIKKAMETGNQQAELIRQYKDQYGLTHINPKLKIVAELRLASPEASYTDLAKEAKDLFNLDITKSGLSYRMNELMKIIKKVYK